MSQEGSGHRICGHFWSTADGALGSNHNCGLEHGHLGPHECLSCHEVLHAQDERPVVTGTDA